MLRVLVNAYACSPEMGSEPGMGWNWCVHLAKYCELHIITEGEFRDKIERTVQTLAQGANMHFYYLPVTEKVRRMCWNQGDWRFYYYYRQWQKRALEKGMEICASQHIDVIHQLNMIGFREPGYLWQISRVNDIPFVWGPIGGLKQFPMAYAKGGSWKMSAFLKLKNFLNIWQLKHNRRVDNAMRQATLLVSSIPESYFAIKKYKGLESVVIPETGTFSCDETSIASKRLKTDCLTILWVGKFDFRKRLDLAIKIMSLAVNANLNIMLKVFGSGNEKQNKTAESLACQMGIEKHIEWMGNCPNSQVKEEMRKADLFLFTSVSEDTSTVVLEAISNHLPVLCFDTCGMSAVITDNIGYKVPLTTPEQSVKDFAEKIEYLYHHREVLVRMSENCQKRVEELSWDNKAKRMYELYLNENVNVNENVNSRELV